MTDPANISTHYGGNPQPTELQQLIQSCIAGERIAQKKLYDHYAPFIYGIIRRYLFNKEAAEEVLNDTFYKVFTKIEQYGSGGSFEGWMRRIAINQVTDHLRRNGKFMQEVHPDVIPEGQYVSDSQVSKMSYKELLAVVHQLPDVHRLVFNLYVFEGLPHKEIAALAGISEGNSRWYLNDARKRLKEKLINHI